MLSYFVMAARKQRRRVVLCAVDHPLLERCIELAEWNRRGATTEGRNHLVSRLARQHTQLHLANIVGAKNRL
jgi:hypothetical protein